MKLLSIALFTLITINLSAVAGDKTRLPAMKYLCHPTGNSYQLLFLGPDHKFHVVSTYKTNKECQDALNSFDYTKY